MCMGHLRITMDLELMIHAMVMDHGMDMGSL
jgi:hypothetical protein